MSDLHAPALRRRRLIDAARSGSDDLRALGGGTPSGHDARHRRARDAARGADPEEPAARAPGGASRGLRARDPPPLQPDLPPELRSRYRLLPARFLHDEAQPAAQRAGGGSAGPRSSPPGAAAETRAGCPRADVAAAAVPGRDLRPPARQPPALGGFARRARGPAAHPRLPRRSRRGANQGAHPGHGAWHQPRHRDDGRLRGGEAGLERARRHRPRRPALQGGRRHGLPDAHEPQHARAIRREHRRDRRDRPLRRRDALLRRRQPERDHGPHAAGRHGLRHRPRQPPQVLLAAARRRWPRCRADRLLGADRAVSAEASGGPARGAERGRAELRPRPRPAEVDRAAARLPGELRRLRALLRLHPQPRRRRSPGGLGDRRAERQLSARPHEPGRGRQVHAGRLRPALHA